MNSEPELVDHQITLEVFSQLNFGLNSLQLNSLITILYKPVHKVGRDMLMRKNISSKIVLSFKSV